MVLKKLMIYIMFIIMAFSVSATSDWYTWGNIGFDTQVGTNDDSILFGSNYPQGTLSMTENIIPINIDRYPVVADLDNSGDNEIILIDDKTLYVFSPSLELIDTVVHTNSLSNAVILNYQSDFDIELVVCEDTDIMIYELDDGSLTLEKEWPNVCGDIGGEFIYADLTLSFLGYDYGSELFTVYAPGFSAIRVFRTNIDNGTRHAGPGNLGGDTSKCIDGFGNAFALDDIDKDGNLEYIALTGGTSTIRISSYEFPDGGQDWSTTLESTGGAEVGSCNLGVAQVGPPGGFKEITANIRNTNLNRSEIWILDKDGNTVLNIGSASTNQSFMPVADFDGDGNNEIMRNGGLGANFYNQLGSSKFSVNVTSVYVDNQRLEYIAIGEYDQELTYMEILTRRGIYSIENVVGSAGELHNVFEFSSSFDEVDTLIYPVSLQSASTFTKDVLVAQSDLVATYLSDVDPAICGNDVCESGENVYNCCSDCCGLTDDVEITEWKICPSPDYDIQNGTDLEVTLKVESNTGAYVQSRVIFYQGDSNQYDTGWSTESPSGYTAVHTRLVNKTGLLQLSLQGRNFPDSSIFTEVDYDINVFEDSGITFEDGICFTGTSTIEIPPLNETLGSYSVGSACTDHTDCESNFCSGGKCHLKYSSDSCTLGSECLSGECLNGKCTATSLYENVEILKDDLVGDDEQTNNIVSIMIIIALILGVILAFGRHVGDAKILAYLGLAVALIGIIFFTFIGWMSPFFLIGIIILALVILVFSFMIRGDSS